MVRAACTEQSGDRKVYRNKMPAAPRPLPTPLFAYRLTPTPTSPLSSPFPLPLPSVPKRPFRHHITRHRPPRTTTRPIRLRDDRGVQMAAAVTLLLRGGVSPRSKDRRAPPRRTEASQLVDHGRYGRHPAQKGPLCTQLRAQQAHAGRELFLAHRLDHRAQPSLFRVVAVGCKKVMQKR